MKNFIAFLISLLIAFSPAGARCERIKIVTTLSSYADIARAIAGENAEVRSIVSPAFNPHFIEPKPSDVLRLKRADLFIHSGMDLEAWRDPLVNAAARSELRSGGDAQLDLSRNLKILEVPEGPLSRAQGDIHIFGNPHYWLDPRNGRIIAGDIAAKLSAIDRPNAGLYRDNLEKFTERLDRKIGEWSVKMKPFAGRELIGYHNEWIYLMNFCGLRMNRFVESKPGVPPGPRYIAELEAYIKEHRIAAIIQATFYPKEAAESLRKSTGIKPLYLFQNVGETEDAPDYIAMIDYNISAIAGALGDG